MCLKDKFGLVKLLPRILKTLTALQIQLNTFMFWFPCYFSTIMSFSPWWYYYSVSNFCLFLMTDLFWVSVLRSCVVVNVLIFIYDSCSSHPLSHFSVFVLVPLCSPVWDLAKCKYLCQHYCSFNYFLLFPALKDLMSWLPPSASSSPFCFQSPVSHVHINNPVLFLSHGL